MINDTATITFSFLISKKQIVKISNFKTTNVTATTQSSPYKSQKRISSPKPAII